MRLQPRGVLLTLSIVLRSNRRQAVIGILLVLLGTLSSPLIGVALSGLVDAVTEDDNTQALLLGVGAALLAIAQLTMGHFAHVVLASLGEQAMVDIEARLVELVQDPRGLARQESGDYADRLALLKDELSTLAFTVHGVLQASAVVIQMALTVILLGGLQPLLLLLPVSAVVPFFAGRHAQRLDERVRLETAEALRAARSFAELALQPGPAKEIRLFGLGDELRRRQRSIFEGVSSALARAERVGATVRSAGQLVFAVAYIAALLLVVRNVVSGEGTIGDVVLTLVLARQVNVGVSQILSLAWTIDRASRLGGHWRWLERAVSEQPVPDGPLLPVPETVREGLSLHEVSFSYKNGHRALHDISVNLPAGAVIALVGENGAGKSTFIKVLCRLYEPVSGKLSLDGTDLDRMALEEWHPGLAVAFQDFCRLEFTAAETVGVGDLPNIGERPAVERAIRRAGAATVVQQLPDGLGTPLGASFPRGHELSGGQWQKLALARSVMRRKPLIFVLDEPTASLDAAAEHELFEHFAAMAREAGRAYGGITVLISHRFSTASMADHIFVLDEGRVLEQGTHHELLARGGRYAELFELQARSYR